MNDLMSGGLHRLWKDQFVRRVRPRSGEAILDMAGGTGDIAFRLRGGRRARDGRRHQSGDARRSGIERARKRGIEGLTWAEENAEALSFADKQLRRLYDRLRHPERHRYRPARCARRTAC